MTVEEIKSAAQSLGLFAYQVADDLASGVDASLSRERLDELIAIIAMTIEQSRCRAD